MFRSSAATPSRLGLAMATMLLGACSAGTGPADGGRSLDAAGTRAAVSTITAPFQSPAVTSFGRFGPAMQSKLGTAALAVPPGDLGAINPAGRPSLLAQAEAQVQAAATRAPAALSIPTTSLGRTFEWNTARGEYVVAATPPAELPAVPANGVRFLLYAWNPVFDAPSQPLSRIGYADYVETTDAAGRTIRVTVTNGTTVALDYSANARFAQATGTFTTTMEGFATAQNTRADFRVTNAASTANNGSLQIDHVVRVDAEQLRAENRHAFANLTSGSPITLNVGLALVNGTSRTEISGQLRAPRPAEPVEDPAELEGFAGTLAVTVNGAAFATITVPEDGEETITTPAGAPLDEDEADALSRVFDMIGSAVEFVQELVEPVRGLLDLD